MKDSLPIHLAIAPTLTMLMLLITSPGVASDVTTVREAHSSQPSVESPCTAEEYRQIEFLLGTWQVRAKDGRDSGVVDVTPLVEGCAFREEWSSPGGRRGFSINTYSQRDGLWRQTYVDNTGAVLHLCGEASPDELLLFDRSAESEGRVDRFAWRPRPDGTVHQSWERSVDSGPWSVVFDGIWTRVLDEHAPDPSLTDALGPFTDLVGLWEMTAIQQTPAGEWKERTPTVSRIEPVLEGKFLREFAELDVSAGRLSYVMLIGFDPFKEIYRLSWNDSLAGLADIYEGRVENGLLVVDNLGSETFWRSSDGKEFAFRLEYELESTEGRRQARVFISQDRGRSWSLFQKTNYRLLKSTL